MESNLNIKTSKLNIETVSSAVFGKEEGGSDIKGGSGKSIKNIHNTLSKLSGHVRKSLVRIKALEGIAKIEKITEKKKDNIGDNQDNLSKSLIETNKILVGIQQQLALQSSNEQKEQKTEIQQEKREKSRGKLKAEESALEKTAKGIGKSVGKVTSKILSPIKGLFDQVLDFILTLGAGVAVNAAFEWLSKEKNRKKVESAFEYVKENWKWIAGVAAGIVLFGPAVSLISAIVSLAGTLLTVGGFVASVLGAPGFLALLAIIGAGAGLYALERTIRGGDAGKRYDTRARDEANASGIRPSVGERGANVLNDDGTVRKVNLFDIPEGDPQKLPGPSLMGRRYNPTTDSGGLGRNARISLNISNEGHRKYILKNDGAQKLKQYDDAETLFRARIEAKDRVKKSMEEEWSEITGRQWGDFLGAFAEIGSLGDKEKRAKIDALNLRYGVNLDELFETMPKRAMGGPVTSGKPYLVGERGPEIFAPNVDGSVINNMRTEKIYQMISSKRKGRGGIDMITLPPITNQMPPPEISVPQGPATEVPDISSVNMADPYRQITPMLYGITV